MEIFATYKASFKAREKIKPSGHRAATGVTGWYLVKPQSGKPMLAK